MTHRGGATARAPWREIPIRNCNDDFGRSCTNGRNGQPRDICAEIAGIRLVLQRVGAERLLPRKSAPMSNGVSRSRYRTFIEWTLSAVALTTIVLVMLSVDSPVRQYATAMMGDVRHSAVAMKVPEPIARVGRDAWRLCMDHKPLAGFAGVGAVLVVFMRRMR
jgi:hypothetical protein